jgi:hypothetical protein
MKIGSARSGRAVRAAGGEAVGRCPKDAAEGLKKRLTCILSMLLPRSIAAASPAEAAVQRCSTVRKKLTN